MEKSKIITGQSWKCKQDGRVVYVQCKPDPDRTILWCAPTKKLTTILDRSLRSRYVLIYDAVLARLAQEAR